MMATVSDSCPMTTRANFTSAPPPLRQQKYPPAAEVESAERAALSSRISYIPLVDECNTKKEPAVNMFMRVVSVIEAMGFRVGARSLVSSEQELRELLTPSRPGTTIRNCRKFMRFVEFYEHRFVM